MVVLTYMYINHVKNIITMKRLKKLFWALSAVALLATYGCSDDEVIGFTDDDIIGVWTVSGTTVDFSVGGMSLIDYLVETLELSEVEALLFEALISEGIDEGFDGTVEMRADNTYVAQFGDDPAENGTWELTVDGTILKLLEAGASEATELNLISINATTMILSYEESEPMDFDQDGVEEEITLLIEMTLTKQ